MMMEPSQVKIIDIEEDAPVLPPDASRLPTCTKEFLLGGHAYFSVINPKHERLSYVIVARDGKRGTQWHGTTSFYLRVHCDGKYRYIGVVQEDGTIACTGRSEFVAGTKEFDVALWALMAVFARQPIRADYAIVHNDKCGKCARMLIERGDRDTGFHLNCVPTPDDE